MSHPTSRAKLWHILERQSIVSYIGDIIDALEKAGLVVTTDYHVPTYDELFGMYNRLGDAYLRGRIKVRWVMCAEIHDALQKQYRQRRYPTPIDLSFGLSETQPTAEFLDNAARTVMEGTRRWGDHSTLFGVPIRLDPAARRVMFEISEEGE